MKISVTVLTKNSEETLASCLQSLEKFHEVVVLDTGSTDLTLDIAATFPNVKIFTAKFSGFGSLHNIASEKASEKWILSLDSDEVLSEALAEEILTLQLDRERVYSLPFYNYFNGKQIRGCGFSPQSTRLYNKTKTRFSEDLLDEEIIKEGLEEVVLKNAIKHYSYRSISHFLKKMELYSSLYAEQNKYKKSSSLLKATLSGLFAFFKSYVLKKGILDGKEGLIISAYHGHITFYKHLKLAEINQIDRAWKK